MKYELVYTRRAEKDIQKLDPGIRGRIGRTLFRYREDPLRFAEKLSALLIFRVKLIPELMITEGNKQQRQSQWNMKLPFGICKPGGIGGLPTPSVGAHLRQAFGGPPTEFALR